MDVYINDVSAFLPNDPVDNDAIEDVLGRVNGLPSRVRRVVLKNNGIRTRYYAMDRGSGRLTHTNAQLAAEAVRRLKPHDGFTPLDIECLACGTTCGDVLFPGHALMVLGELGIPECDAVTTHGICVSGMTALKYAFMNVATGSSTNAVAAASELSSSFMRARFFTEGREIEADLEQKPILGFDADFLRWMLSDGAGAMFLSGRPNPDRVSLRVDWIENVSFAGRLDTCQYSGGAKREDGSVVGWRDVESIPADGGKGVFNVRQDIKLLDREIVVTAIDHALLRAAAKHDLKPEDVDWFLPHYSSAYFRGRFHERMCDVGFEIPYDRWFTNLPTTGNTGSAAIYIILEEFLRSDRPRKGQRVLCFIPESGRFSHCYMMLTVV